MKKIIQLSENRKKAFWKWNHDEMVPIEDMFTPEFVSRMVDITGVDPEPQEGWDYDGTSFHPPEVIVDIEAKDLILSPGSGIIMSIKDGVTVRLFIDENGKLITEEIIG